MCNRTKLKLVGVDRWGRQASWPMFEDDGVLCVPVRKRDSLRRKLVHYRSFARKNLAYSYVIEE